MSKQRKKPTPKLSHACQALEIIAPLQLAQPWDNVGLLAGDLRQSVAKALLCIDLTPEVAREAIRGKYDILIAYHPPIFKPVARLTAQSKGPEAAVFECIRAGIAVYSTHTALDAADGGTNDVLAKRCGITDTEPLEYVDDPRRSEVKCVTFVPVDQVDSVASAMFDAGAGHIGDYTKCSHRIEGEGTFHGGESTQPAIGTKGQLEHVAEVRLETVCSTRSIPKVVAALVRAHPYEEPAYDICPLQAPPVRGIGRCGLLPKPIGLAALARKLKKAIGANNVQIVGLAGREVTRAIIVAGAAGSLPFKMGLTPSDVIITGEIRHHDALTILRKECVAIALSHWSSEQPALRSVADRLSQMVPGITTKLSQADNEPFRPI